MGLWRDFWAGCCGRPLHCDKHDDDQLDNAAVLSDIQADAAATRLSVNTAIRKIDQLQRDVRIMAEREDQAWASFNSKVEIIKQGWAAKDAEIANLRAQLENAGVDAQRQVQAALDADSAVDATKVEAADAALAELVAQPAGPTPEPAPADGQVDPAPEVDPTPQPSPEPQEQPAEDRPQA